MKTSVFIASCFLLAGCYVSHENGILKGMVIDATMNTVSVITAGKDTLSFSTMNSDKTALKELLLGDSIEICFAGKYVPGMEAKSLSTISKAPTASHTGVECHQSGLDPGGTVPLRPVSWHPQAAHQARPSQQARDSHQGDLRRRGPEGQAAQRLQPGKCYGEHYAGHQVRLRPFLQAHTSRAVCRLVVMKCRLVAGFRQLPTKQGHPSPDAPSSLRKLSNKSERGIYKFVT